MFNILAAQSAMEEFSFHICNALKQGISQGKDFIIRAIQ